MNVSINERLNHQQALTVQIIWPKRAQIKRLLLLPRARQDSEGCAQRRLETPPSQEALLPYCEAGNTTTAADTRAMVAVGCSLFTIKQVKNHNLPGHRGRSEQGRRPRDF